MNGLYTETCVKRKATIGGYLAKAGIIFGVVLLFLIAMMLGGTGVIGYIVSLLAAALVVALFIIIPKFNVDYEYIFCDGQIDFDQIAGGDKRKHKLRIDMENVEIMAPETSHQLDSYRMQKVIVKDFSSRDMSAKRYVIFISKGAERMKIIFEPSEKMVQFAKQKGPRKVFVD